MKRSTSLWLGMLMFGSMLFGVAGGGVMGGVAGYYVASTQKSAAVSLVSAGPSAVPLLIQQNGSGDESPDNDSLADGTKLVPLPQSQPGHPVFNCPR